MNQKTPNATYSEYRQPTALPRNALTLVAETIAEAAAAVQKVYSEQPRVGLILGSGMGGLAEEMQVEAELSYREIPHFVRSTAAGHDGRLVCGKIAGVPVVAMKGRFHLYEGYGVDEVVLPVHVMAKLGIEMLVASNASGGLNPSYAAGDLMLLEDHLDLLFAVGRPKPSVCDSGRSLGRQSPYCSDLIDNALRIARRGGFTAHRGVYVGVPGPNYETRAEVRLLRKMGGDVVGMSTIPEVAAAKSLNLRVMAISVVTNVANPDAPRTVYHEEVMASADFVGPNMRRIVWETVAEMGK